MRYPNIEAERARSGLTKGAMCERVGISRNTYSNIQSGNHEAAMKTFVKLSNLFGCTVDKLLEGEGNGTLDEH